MPLPPNCTLSLLGHSRPGDTVHSNPKQAILIRLSTETLDTLEANPDAMKVDFRDNPILWIGASKFVLNAAKENLHHELYLRATSATKKNAPLKLHANVIGKFQVERQLDNEFRTRLRQSTRSLQEQRQERTIIQLDPPTQPPSKHHKVKLPRATFDRAPRDPPLAQRSKELPVSMRHKMLQLLAINDRTADEVIKSLCGSNCTSHEQLDLVDLLEQLAEPVLNTSGPDLGLKSKTYRLKLKTWLEARPNAWDWANDHERAAVSAKLESALNKLGITDTDPIWNHTLSRNGRMSTSMASAAPTMSYSLASLGTDNGMKHEGIMERIKFSRPSKEKKSKTADFGTDPVTDDVSKMVTAHRKNKELTSALSLPPAPKASSPLRKPPGSGFRLGKPTRRVSSLNIAEASDGTHRSEVGQRPRDTSSLSRESPATAYVVYAEQAHPLKKLDSDISQSLTKTRPGGLDRSCTEDRQGISDGTLPKRREPEGTAPRAPVFKKRRLDLLHAHSSTENKIREPSKRLTKIISSKGGAKLMARVSSSCTSSPADNSSPSQRISKKGRRNAKRRHSPIYTSSDDDEPAHSNSIMTSRHTLPADHASLRRRYVSSYGEYLTAFHKLVTMRNKIDNILRDHEGISVYSVSDSDVDLELLDPDKLGLLFSHHNQLRDELESIQQSFSHSSGKDTS
ncbi:hypothetical protein AX17_004773 [Amanita inopinata Kibby_2008]|nr:hypothetical protein AX17_004773 [Amanita inopinata Kibby_2008]